MKERIQLKSKVKSKKFREIPNNVKISITWNKRKQKAGLKIEPDTLFPHVAYQIINGVLKNIGSLCNEEEYKEKSPSYIA